MRLNVLLVLGLRGVLLSCPDKGHMGTCPGITTGGGLLGGAWWPLLTILELRGQVSRRLPRTQDAALSVRTGHSACRGSE